MSSSTPPPPPPSTRPPPPPSNGGGEAARRPSAPPPPPRPSFTSASIPAPPAENNPPAQPKSPPPPTRASFISPSVPPPPIGGISPAPPAAARTTSTAKNAPKFVWISSQSKVWEQAEVLGEDDEDRIKLRPLQGKTELVVSKADVHPTNPTVVGDMTSLHFLHEAGILFNLQERYQTSQIYTYMGSALIALNPFAKVASPNVQEYLKGSANCPPHPYAIAENAFSNLNVLKRNQSIVISGESGAGKTETAKIIVKYLADRNRLQAGQSSSAGGMDQLYDRLHGLSPILESFGNAKTTRNGNSSRFGKFMKLVFERSTEQKTRKAASASSLRIIGAKIETYLLEKSRVTHHSAAEQNFHVFYSLLHHPPSHLATLVSDRHHNPFNFRILNLAEKKSQSYLLDSSHHLDQIASALKTLGLNEQEINDIWTVLIALLYIGNISFEEFDTLEGPVARVQTSAATSADSGDGVNAGYSGMYYLKTAADLLKVEHNDLRLLLTQRQVETRGETFHVSLTVREACFTRDAVAKAIYEALFAYLVKVMNKALSKDIPEVEDSSKEEFIGVLDIFGFESFDQNGYEQLLINYANEALQNTFNKQIFEREKLLFEEEKIEVNIGECPSNQGCVDLICKKGESILAKLDSISRQPNPTDARFCEELHKAFTKKSKYFGNVHRKDMAHSFVVHHYAAHVSYQVAANISGNTTAAVSIQEFSWIGKNNDSIPDGLEALYQSSGLNSFRNLSVLQAAGNVAGAKVRRKSIMMKPTIAEIFSKSMNELNDVLESTNCHFIRCVKPNFAMKAGEYDLKYVVEQIRSLGILQTCEVLSVSLPTRVAYVDLMAALDPIVRQVQHHFQHAGLSGAKKDVLLISSLLRAFQIPPDSYRLGATIAFFRPGQLALLETILNQNELSKEKEGEVVGTIEASIQQYQQMTNAISELQEEMQRLTSHTNKLEERQEVLQQRISSVFAEADTIGLNIPEEIASQINKIEHRFEKLRNKHNESLKKKLLLIPFLLEQDIVVDETGDFSSPGQLYGAAQLQTIKDQVHEFWHAFTSNEAIMTAISLQSNQIHQLIEDLEDSHGQDDSKTVLMDAMDRVNECFEDLLDLLSVGQEQCEGLVIFAERINADKVKEQLTVLLGTKAKIHSLMQTIEDSLDKSDASLRDMEGDKGQQGVNFEEVELALRRIMSDLECGDNTCMQCLELEKVVRTSVYSLKPLPPLSETLPVEEKPVEEQPVAKSAPPPKPPKGRSGSINYSFKDLALMKQQKRSEAAATTSSPSATTRKDQKAGEEESGLPPDWKEVVDPKSNKTYFVNKATKERQWKRPSLLPCSVPPLPQEEPPVEEAVSEEKPLPAGWKEAFDKKTNRVYYINEVTKERQWKRPEGHSPHKDSSNRMSTRIANVDRMSTRDIAAVSPEPVDRMSRRLASPSSDHRMSSRLSADVAFLSPAQSSSALNTPTNLVEEAQTRGRAQHRELLSMELDDEDFVMRQSLAYMMRLGVQDKTGYLSKQSKFLGRWRKRFFVLHESTLAYYDSEKDYRKALSSNSRMAKAEKVFNLKGNSITSFTTAENCFSITNLGEEDDEETSWYLFADVDKELDDWMRAINAHIHIQFVEEAALEEEDYWNNGTVALSLWKVPGSATVGSQRRPVGIRTLPLVNGPRTGDGLYPGDIVEVNQVVVDDSNSDKPQRYLRLANDRGWVFENHPTADYAIMVPAGGELVECIRKYEYSANFLEPLGIFFTPYCNADSAEGDDGQTLGIQPGNVIEGCAEWRIDSTLLFHNLGYTEYEDEDPTTLCFVKLRDGRGWVPMFHAVTGGQLLIVMK